MSDAREELFVRLAHLEAACGSDVLSAGAPAYTWLDGVTLGLGTRGDDRTAGSVYPSPEED